MTDDPFLSDLLHEAVDQLEPADRLGAIREATSAGRRSRVGWYAVGGSALLAAAVVTAVALVDAPGSRSVDPSHRGSDTSQPTPGLFPYAVYDIGSTPSGPRLFREFRLGYGPGEGPSAAQLVTQPPEDPDYTTLWPAHAFAAEWDRRDHFEVALANGDLLNPLAGMTPEQAALSVQQVVYTLQAARGARLPVTFTLDGEPVDHVLGVDTSAPLTAAPQLDVLAQVSISDPVEGQHVSGSFTADGRASSFEGNVPWEIRSPDGTVVKKGFAQAGMDTHLIPWKVHIDVTGLLPGTYTFAAMTDDPSGGEGTGPTTDTRTIVIG